MAKRRRKQPSVDAIAMLKADHQKVRNLFQACEGASNLRTKRELAEEACTALEIHTQLEEQVFYPAVNEETNNGPELVKESFAEHQTVKNLIQGLRNMASDTDEFDAMFQELIRHVDHHVEEEESEMFPLAEVELADDMKELTEEMQELKQAIMAS